MFLEMTFDCFLNAVTVERGTTYRAAEEAFGLRIDELYLAAVETYLDILVFYLVAVEQQFFFLG